MIQRVPVPAECCEWSFVAISDIAICRNAGNWVAELGSLLSQSLARPTLPP